MIEEGHLVSNAREEETNGSLDSCLENGFVKGLSLHEINDSIRKARKERLLKGYTSNYTKNKKRTCEALGIDYSTLFRKMKEYAIR